jgi:predicted transcriptional regulator of viral defense system
MLRPFQQRKRMTQVAETLARALISQPKPVLSNYDIFRELWIIYQSGTAKYLRGETPSREVFRRTRSLLRSEGIIRQDNDYRTHWRLVDKPDAPAEDVICSVDPFCHIAHLSALQRYGLTNRRPEHLLLVEPTPVLRRELVRELMERDYGEVLEDTDADIEPAKAVLHPDTVRGRPISIDTTKFSGDQIPIKGSLSRIATIGQTFLDTLASPDESGGMSHVLDIWSEYAATYLEEIIERVTRAEKGIWKVRAGYILEEHIGISDPRISAWASFAQRGSSRVLDPGKPFDPLFSEKWMLSLNV